MKSPHPWHRVPATRAERRMLRDLEQQLITAHGDTTPAGRIIRMLYGAAHLLRSAGLHDEALVDQVARACNLALDEPDGVTRIRGSRERPRSPADVGTSHR